jgi:hypothetical protein
MKAASVAPMPGKMPQKKPITIERSTKNQLL